MLFDDDALADRRARGRASRKHGIEARHLRMYRSFAEREATLYGQVIQGVLRQRNPEARAPAPRRPRRARGARPRPAQRVPAPRRRRPARRVSPWRRRDAARSERADLAADRRAARRGDRGATIPTASCSSACSRARSSSSPTWRAAIHGIDVADRLHRDLAVRARQRPGADPEGRRARPHRPRRRGGRGHRRHRPDRRPTCCRQLAERGPAPPRRVHAARPAGAADRARSTCATAASRSPTCSCSATGCTWPTCTGTWTRSYEADRRVVRADPAAYVDGALRRRRDGGRLSTGRGCRTV